ncbi:hypothetical protein [Parvularcula sp. LCG005]|uniref:hypothetical protein n=1 Tax=Parvularcula sp. LCG005 TaxID=3078805 RepID=UPI002941C997|nr:hypothetical protein [Parvularcula sp. LCG005]WOI53157.1 hypothetical protein RUI03_13495 [Parvularcula sp. LCG005]
MGPLRKIRLVLSVACASLICGQSIAQPLQTKTILDVNGFERPIPAFTVGIPQGWDLTGGVKWRQTTCSSSANQAEWQASANDGSDRQIVFFPVETWYWGSMLDQMPQFANSGGTGCPAARVFDAPSYLQMVITARRPGVRIIGMRPRPDATAQMQQAISSQQLPGGMQVRFEAVEALIAYNMNGKEMRESLMTIVQFMRTPTVDMNGGMGGYIMSATSFGVIGLKAPNGQLDFNLMEQVRRSLQFDPGYERRMAAYYAKVNRSRRAARPSGVSAQAQLNKTYSEISDIQHKGYMDRSAIEDSMQARTTDMILEQQGYVTGYGEVVKLPNAYDRAYELQNGGFVVTDSPSFDPYLDTGVDGTEMQREEY